jgi:hypothetical protein
MGPEIIDNEQIEPVSGAGVSARFVVTQSTDLNSINR